ncbi:polysaccharide pyruvyl transferase family protein [Spirosoma sp. HMF3257]|uniref:Polysaccharide pyruvyl transferase family protein n=1 Tax=Spirosoma telluris TaxID=2183553 RepID=A0A327NHI8_9BACT|nr:polysaccharide pyruvyl transferase family protein [Spirosoma telluris]RAI74722.1 polysaccharide pyruvyl transferase family protein [Spirosoma telluris]
MKRVFLFEPSIASNNLGDQIIVNSIKKEMWEFFNESQIVEFATHTPLSNRYFYYLGRPDYKFVLGSNIVVGKLNHTIHLKQWMIDIFTAHNLSNTIFVGVGSQQYGQQINLYTRFMYKRFFHSQFLHSVRDSYTEDALKSIGIKNVINTACPTMWRFNKDYCKSIPKKKSHSVIFTLTDYKPNVKRDEYFINVLKSNYKNVFFWGQGFHDYSYLKKLANSDGIKLVNPNLESYDNILKGEDVDFVGTRLHGGIRALQLGKRSLILGIDNRAIELQKDFNLPVILDSNIKDLEMVLNSDINTDIELPIDNIKKFLSQFNINYK